MKIKTISLSSNYIFQGKRLMHFIEIESNERDNQRAGC